MSLVTFLKSLLVPEKSATPEIDNDEVEQFPMDEFSAEDNYYGLDINLNLDTDTD